MQDRMNRPALWSYQFLVGTPGYLLIYMTDNSTSAQVLRLGLATKPMENSISLFLTRVFPLTLRVTRFLQYRHRPEGPDDPTRSATSSSWYGTRREGGGDR